LAVSTSTYFSTTVNPGHLLFLKKKELYPERVKKKREILLPVTEKKLAISTEG
jgi:hypothetical protein